MKMKRYNYYGAEIFTMWPVVLQKATAFIKLLSKFDK